MKKIVAPHVRANARKLKTSQSDAERLLWATLRAARFQDWKFRRQVPIGNFIADFVCHEAKLIVEADGDQHGNALSYDAARSSFMASQGYRVLRFWNRDIFQHKEMVLEAIWHALEGSLPMERYDPPVGTGAGHRYQ
jgi:very-short-patch-repair endonuclease